MLTRLIIILLAPIVFLTGCENMSKRDTGAVLGGIAGGIIGNQVGKGSGRTAAIIVGSIAGSFIGGSIGKQMDENDRYRSQQALESNPVNRTSSWRNPDSGNTYQVTPTRTYESDSGPCREYTTEAVINGRSETIYGTACRQPDGSWQAAN
ncbi:RT0821/Lpp0805 family surface protein [Sedimenticola selenatireducens]|uniref:Glycine zipper 2TM domain-containing protein n=1 Tax=Sedimenticola selenatireducens TaxID=191960 RepID=A0A558DWZ5_9GAMM|nr:glycine zipper 2TM domain-containing protein [Sedimenticola selenatireducens]TVT65428.1 MAG: glycine zipper 2TM domain-containing protein [Sedimenticola selenatireducens]